MGVDRDSGAGIIMADAALQSLGAAPSANFEIGAVTVTEAGGNGNGLIERNEGGTVTVQLRNTGVVNATGVTANLTTSTPGVTVTQGASTYPDLPAPSGVGTNATPFAFTLSSNAACPLQINFTLTINYAGGPSPKVTNFSVQTGTPPLTINSILDTTAPLSGSGFTATTGLQTGRLNRSGLVTGCGFPTACPGLIANDSLRAAMMLILSPIAPPAAPVLRPPSPPPARQPRPPSSPPPIWGASIQAAFALTI